MRAALLFWAKLVFCCMEPLKYCRNVADVKTLWYGEVVSKNRYPHLRIRHRRADAEHIRPETNPIQVSFRMEEYIMKKLSKRFLTLAIACVMAMAMAVPAFAATNAILSPVGRGNIRVNGYGIAGTARLTASSSVAQSKVVLQPASSMTNQKWTVEGSGNEGTIYTAQTPSGTRLAVNLWRVAGSSGVYPATLAATTGNTDDTYFHFSNYNSYRFRAWLNQGTYAGYRLYIDKSSTTSQYSDVYFVNSDKDPNTLWYWSLAS